MSNVSYTQLISAKHLQDLGYCMIALATCFTVARLGIRAWKRRWWLIEDITVTLAWACFTAMTIGYICVTPAVYRIADVGTGKIPPYPTIKDDAQYLVKIFFPNTLLLWTTLWLVKFSLLLQCRRLVDRRPAYIKVWWGIVVFTGIAYAGCIVTEFTSCRTLHDWFTFGQCSTARDARASTISLFYAYAVDVITDLMSMPVLLWSVAAVLTGCVVMIFPLRLLWNLQLNLIRKISLMAIFGVGIICLVTSTIRVVQIQSKSNSKQPSPSWLEVWAIIEAAIAVVVACLPTFGLLLPPSKSKVYGYSGSGSGLKSGPRERSQRDDIILRNRSSQHGYGTPVIEGATSTERLKMGSPDGVLVTTTVNVEEPMEADGDSYTKTSTKEHHANHMV
ncbi:MAG: hypothetical protein Q9220_006265 [cf. Caloplaca sp. 1 TL-2023]